MCSFSAKHGMYVSKWRKLIKYQDASIKNKKHFKQGKYLQQELPAALHSSHFLSTCNYIKNYITLLEWFLEQKHGKAREIQTHVCKGMMNQSAAPSHIVASKFHCCACKPAVMADI